MDTMRTWEIPMNTAPTNDPRLLPPMELAPPRLDPRRNRQGRAAVVSTTSQESAASVTKGRRWGTCWFDSQGPIVASHKTDPPTGIDRILPDLSKLWHIHRHRRVICAGAGGSEPSKVNVAVLGYGVSASADDRLCYEAVFAGRPLFRRPLVRAVVAASSTTSPTCASNPSRRHQRVPQAAQLTRTSSWPPTPSSMITSSFSRQTGHNASTLFSLHPCSEARKPQFVSFG
jgi:hypothetical protein